jgi:hypothetical protein
MESSRFAMDAACCSLSLHRNCGRTDLSAGRHPLRGKAGAGGFPHAAGTPCASGAASRWSGSICGIEREKKLRMAATSALTFTTFS